MKKYLIAWRHEILETEGKTKVPLSRAHAYGFVDLLNLAHPFIHHWVESVKENEKDGDSETVLLKVR
jgi:hypothetical protein